MSGLWIICIAVCLLESHIVASQDSEGHFLRSLKSGGNDDNEGTNAGHFIRALRSAHFLRALRAYGDLQRILRSDPTASEANKAEEEVVDGNSNKEDLMRVLRNN